MDRRTLAFVLAGIVGLPGCCNTDPLPPEAESDLPAASAAPPPARCKMLGREEVVGQKSNNPADLDKVLPFATEVGQGVAFESGFAVGALHQQGAGTASIVVTTNRDGTVWKTLPTGTSHGDAEAPRVFARGNTLGAAVLEPSGASRTLRIARIDRSQVLWGAEFLQGHDESLAYDVVIGNTRGVAVWDDVPKDREVSAIHLATFDPKTFEKPSPGKVMTLPGTDAEMPRVIERPGGFWLFWLARRPGAGSGADDTRYRAEDIAYRWLEAVPLDDSGALSGTPTKLGPTDGHVLAYDVTSMEDDSVVVMWRDDDTPSGSAGGQLYRVRVRLGGVDGPDRIDEEHVGVGTPNVMRGWFAIADAMRPTRLAPLNPDGSLGDKLMSEELFGAGEPVANHGNDLLVSRPDGVAVRLFLARCDRAALDGGSRDE